MTAVGWAATLGQTVYRNEDGLEGNALWIVLGCLAGLVAVVTMIGLVRSWRADQGRERTQRHRDAAAAARAIDELGIEVDPASAGATGVVVAAVVPGSPADDAGVQAGDALTALGGRAVASAGELRERMRGEDPRASLTLTVVRAGRASTMTVAGGRDRPATGARSP